MVRPSVVTVIFLKIINMNIFHYFWNDGIHHLKCTNDIVLYDIVLHKSPEVHTYFKSDLKKLRYNFNFAFLTFSISLSCD